MIIYNADAKEQLETMEENCIDLLCTDPPYGYSFMNKDWDKAVIPVDTWKECLRVLKPGAFAFVMSSPRQDVLSRMICNLQDAGFETNFTSIYWTYSSGFPKAADISKLVDKKFNGEREIVGTKATKNQLNIKGGNFTVTDGNPVMGNLSITKPATEQAKKLEGSYAGFQPKPAVEVILVCMKPLSEKSFTDQALKNGKGITWLDDCRIPYKSDKDMDKRTWKLPVIKQRTKLVEQGFRPESYLNTDKIVYAEENEKGRFPANILVSDDVLNDSTIHKSGKFAEHHIIRSRKGIIQNYRSYGRDDISVEMNRSYGDSGSYSRYFSLDKWFDTTFPFLIVPKASKSEKNQGLDKWIPQKVNDGRKAYCDWPQQRGETLRLNIHPTTKPIKLMSYLIMLGSREKNDIVLDPFCGSGTTCIAAKMLNRNYIGIEINKEYVEIAEARLSATTKTKEKEMIGSLFPFEAQT